MARIARVVVPGVPHHVTQRGNRRQTTFFEPGDFSLYKHLLGEECRDAGTAIWAYCLMPNHVHLILMPSAPESLARAVGETHRRYTEIVNQRQKWRGFLWQGRFASFPMDELHVLRAVRYVLLNPVVAGLAATAVGWPHSSARAHLSGRDDGITCLDALHRRIGDWESLLGRPLAAEETVAVERHQRTGRPLGATAFLERVEAVVGRQVRPRRRGPKASVQPGG